MNILKTLLLFMSLTFTLPLAAQHESDSITVTQKEQKRNIFSAMWHSIFPHRPKDSSEDRNILRAALKGWEVSINSGLALGGASPLPLPRSVRKINSYNPQLNTYIGGAAHKHLQGPWSMSVGLKFETKGMTTDANVSNYQLRITSNDGGSMEGGWYGPVKTKLRCVYMTLPLLAHYTLPNRRWIFTAGPYASWMMNGEFSGSVSDGYIRTPDETGENVEVDYATYDFSSSLRRFQWGLQIGSSFCAYRHLFVDASLQWGLNGIFPKDFETISFALYPIYGNLGFSYRF